MRTSTKSHGRAQAPKRNIPSPTAAGYLAIYDLQDLVATIVQRDSSHFAFGADGVLLGEYPSYAQAVAALPPVQS